MFSYMVSTIDGHIRYFWFLEDALAYWNVCVSFNGEAALYKNEWRKGAKNG